MVNMRPHRKPWRASVAGLLGAVCWRGLGGSGESHGPGLLRLMGVAEPPTRPPCAARSWRPAPHDQMLFQKRASADLCISRTCAPRQGQSIASSFCPRHATSDSPAAALAEHAPSPHIPYLAPRVSHRTSQPERLSVALRPVDDLRVSRVLIPISRKILLAVSVPKSAIGC